MNSLLSTRYERVGNWRAVPDLIDWLRTDHSEQIDPVVIASMAHYQFEALHPFRTATAESAGC